MRAWLAVEQSAKGDAESTASAVQSCAEGVPVSERVGPSGESTAVEAKAVWSEPTPASPSTDPSVASEPLFVVVVIGVCSFVLLGGWWFVDGLDASCERDASRHGDVLDDLEGFFWGDDDGGVVGGVVCEWVDGQGAADGEDGCDDECSDVLHVCCWWWWCWCCCRC